MCIYLLAFSHPWTVIAEPFYKTDSLVATAVALNRIGAEKYSSICTRWDENIFQYLLPGRTMRNFCVNFGILYSAKFVKLPTFHSILENTLHELEWHGGTYLNDSGECDWEPGWMMTVAWADESRDSKAMKPVAMCECLGFNTPVWHPRGTNTFAFDIQSIGGKEVANS